MCRPWYWVYYLYVLIGLKLPKFFSHLQCLRPWEINTWFALIPFACACSARGWYLMPTVLAPLRKIIELALLTSAHTYGACGSSLAPTAITSYRKYIFFFAHFNLHLQHCSCSLVPTEIASCRKIQSLLWSLLIVPTVLASFQKKEFALITSACTCACRNCDHSIGCVAFLHFMIV